MLPLYHRDNENRFGCEDLNLGFPGHDRTFFQTELQPTFYESFYDLLRSEFARQGSNPDLLSHNEICRNHHTTRNRHRAELNRRHKLTRPVFYR